MAVRRLHPEQPAEFQFSPVNLAWAKATIAKYPPGKQASAILPLLWRAQEQSGGWLTEPAIRSVCDMLGMAHIRGVEVATFYTMFQLSPVGSKAHVQVCGTTPCMLRGSGELVELCKRRISDKQHTLNAEGTLSWEEVECIGNCANAPAVQIGKDTYEDLTPALLDGVIDGYLRGKQLKLGSQTGRKASCPAGGPTSLKDPSLYDGSTVGAWRKRFEGIASEKVEQEKAPAIHPAAAAAMANAGLVKELETRGTGKPLTAGELEKIKTDMLRGAAPSAASASAPAAATSTASKDGAVAAVSPTASGTRPELLDAPRGGKGDDLSLLWGVAEKLSEKLNAMGIWHFEQIAKWTPENVIWFEDQLTGFKGRVVRDKWIEQARKLADGWRPDSAVGERPKD